MSGRSMRGKLSRRIASTVGATVAILLAAAAPAMADTTPVWDVEIQVNTDGTFDVTETITQNFEVSRRGIFRYIPVTERIADNGLVEVPDGTVDDWFQRIRLEDIRVRSSSAPTETLVEKPSRHESGGVVSIRIGEEDTYITGVHTYTISYHVVGALLPLDEGRTVLRWDVVGDGWQQDIAQATVRVTGPGLLADEAVCTASTSLDQFAFELPAGLEGLDLEGFDLEALQGLDLEALAGLGLLAEGEGVAGCVPTSTSNGYSAQAANLGAYNPMSIQVPFDSAVVPASDPILQRRFTLTGALWGDGRAWPTFFVLLGVLAAVLGRLLFREGRDRETRGDVTVDGRTDTTHLQYVSQERSRPLFTPRPVPIEFRPPDDLRPGEIGLIIDERVDPVDVAATIVDLAVRGHLVIEEDVSKTLWWTNTDWTLRSTDKPTDELMSFERHLYDGLFDGRSEVSVSELKGTFASDYGKAERALYEQGRKRKWFAARPDKTRTKWLVIGILSFIAALGLFGAAVYLSRMAIAVVPLVLAGLVLLIAHRWMPRRTPKGSELLTRALGFREFIETAETDRARFAEQEHLFVDFLPYAIVFGATEKWARAFADLGILTAGTGLGGWYVWHAGSGGFDARAFSSGISGFSSTVGTAAATAPPSSSSGGGGGFSGGGGFGGGGGGSW